MTAGVLPAGRSGRWAGNDPVRLHAWLSRRSRTWVLSHGKLCRVIDRDKSPGPPRFAWAVALICFGAALLLVAILLYASHPEWF